LTNAILPVPLDHPSAKNRFILDLRNHKLVKLPSSVIDALTLWLRRDGRGSGILKGFLRSILLEPFRRKKRLDAKVPSTSNLTVLETQINDTSVDNLVRRTLGPRIADSLISSMVHGIYAADSRVLSVRSTFPVLWDALQARGSLVLGLLRPACSVRREDAARAEKEAWESLGGDMDAQRKTWSIYGIRGGVETLTKKLEQEIHKLGVDVRVGQTIEKLEPTDDGCRVSHRNAKKNGAHSLISDGLIGYSSGLTFLGGNFGHNNGRLDTLSCSASRSLT
jgi:oxygen-dependent protoporphyrinogen oxidase